MRASLVSLLACLLLQNSCGNVRGRLQKQSADQATQNKINSNSGIDKEAAVRVVKDNASKSYSLERYNIVSCEQDVFWRVFLDPKDARASQKGVEYVIDKQIGSIVSQRELPLATRNGTEENLLSKPEMKKEDAVIIAKKDGIKAYDSLKSYDLMVCELKHVWIVVFSPKEGLDGGGPEYVIDKSTGKILDKKYYQ